MVFEVGGGPGGLQLDFYGHTSPVRRMTPGRVRESNPSGLLFIFFSSKSKSPIFF